MHFVILFSFFLSSSFLPSPNLGLTPPGTYNPNARGKDACRGSKRLWTITLEGGPPWMCGQQNVIASAGDSTGQNTGKGYTPNPRIGIKIPDPPGIEPGPPGWKVGTLPTTPRDRFYYSLDEILSSHLLSKKFKINTCKTILYYHLYSMVVKFGLSPWEESIVKGDRK